VTKMIVESRWNVDWQGKPKFSEKICPSATFVHHKIPHDQTRIWTRAAAVGSQRLTDHYMLTYPFGIRIRPFLFQTFDNRIFFRQWLEDAWKATQGIITQI
jgi:hypothetical protein